MFSADPTPGVGHKLIARLGRVRWSTASIARATGTAGPGSHAALELLIPLPCPFRAGHGLVFPWLRLLDLSRSSRHELGARRLSLFACSRRRSVSGGFVCFPVSKHGSVHGLPDTIRYCSPVATIVVWRRAECDCEKLGCVPMCSVGRSWNVGKPWNVAS